MTDTQRAIEEGAKEHQKAQLKAAFEEGENSQAAWERGFDADNFEEWYSKVYENPNKKSQ